MARHSRGPRLKIAITAEAIDHAMPRDSRHCMIAESIAAAVPKASSISVDLATIRFSDLEKRLRYTYLTPRVAQVQLVKFDQGMKPEPFVMMLKNAHVTRAGNTPSRAIRDKRKRETEQKTDSAAPDAATEPEDDLRTAKLRTVEGAFYPVPIGGATPPLQSTGDGLPFSRRRAFGIRALDY